MHTLRRREGGELTITHTHTKGGECNSTSTKFSLIPGVNLTLRWSTSHGRTWEAKTVQIWGGPSGYSSMTSLNSSSVEDSKLIYVIYEKGRKDYDESISLVKIHLFGGQDRMWGRAGWGGWSFMMEKLEFSSQPLRKGNEYRMLLSCWWLQGCSQPWWLWLVLWLWA